MKRTTKIFLSTSLACLAVSFAVNVGVLLLWSADASAGKIRLRQNRELDLVDRVYRAIREQYVEKEKARDETALIHGGVEGMLKALDDPYTRFMRPQNYSEMRTESKGEFGGLGIVIGMRDGHVTVISPMSGTPAYKKGVQAGDLIVKINGEPVEGLSLNQVVEQLRGKVGTKVEVTLFRPSLRQLIPVEITRAKIPLPGVRTALLPGNVGYAYAPSFTEKTALEIEEALSGWEKEDLAGFILDLRSNPGGLLDAAVAVCQIFLGPGTIVSVKNRVGTEKKFQTFERKHGNWPLVVLIDEGSASASEIVAGAIRDQNRGLLLGKKSFGKGSVQTVIPLVDGSALALTTAYYYTPSGELIHKKGIEPHISVQLRPLTTDEVIKLRTTRSRLLGEPTLDEDGKEQEPLSTAEVFTQLKPLDAQLAAAHELLTQAGLVRELEADALAKR
jgi:carboxyl-terminal processing protease